ncbi:hypothetical protein SARC_01216 [Sphaeroforma arctica JP610]|uniref:YHYH domain-containing protein n=1 Tax=Sphaeroforma arctica JP610 TaxID=667725 RepID=A0A0L0GCM8_9EUKA|nr:hypothetical protein SARC_01216 [Sphaeroforma arctica JP610]KNC86636.1 hypothetical protein SARC_01216 [Sphaeroforma arctica JP610]|eukprot:XP_014160538.1 hypothetical protein SARC_01216 [Sphaeroforma arctica JP610]
MMIRISTLVTVSLLNTLATAQPPQGGGGMGPPGAAIPTGTVPQSVAPGVNANGTGTGVAGAGQGRPAGGPGGGMGGGSTSSESSTECATADGVACNQDGSSNEFSGSLTYDASSGLLSGTVIFNQCPNSDPSGRVDDGFDYRIIATSDCQEMTFPVDGYNTTGPWAAPLRNRIGISLYGVNIYGPFEAGFVEGFVCDGSCSAGVDVPACDATLEFQCGAENVDTSLLLDPCSGHATPYHFHADLSCEYDQNALGHSPMIGLALDGRGIYGLNEGNADGVAVQPTDLDFCGGHYGAVEEGGTEVYHYHTQTTAPYVLGCFGPGVDTVEQCRALYPDTCGTGFLILETESGRTCYDTDCPCYFADGTNTDYTETTCPV